MNELKFLVWSPDVVFPVYLMDSESSATAAAETLARDYRGKRFIVASVIATVVAPLPAVEWSYGGAETCQNTVGSACADTNKDNGLIPPDQLQKGPRT